jgi:hypothetical protein
VGFTWHGKIIGVGGSYTVNGSWLICKPRNGVKCDQTAQTPCTEIQPKN